ncbi:hypothetical protein TNCV_3122651 [Trichonephila clavipes]|nr:hypothetical protein TNCV_3122651 [Trichonephila clavipes]
MIVQFRNEKVSNHSSIPITIDCNVVAFIVFEEGFHQPIKRTKQSVFLDDTVESPEKRDLDRGLNRDWSRKRGGRLGPMNAGGVGELETMS